MIKSLFQHIETLQTANKTQSSEKLVTEYLVFHSIATQFPKYLVVDILNKNSGFTRLVHVSCQNGLFILRSFIFLLSFIYILFLPSFIYI